MTKRSPSTRAVTRTPTSADFDIEGAATREWSRASEELAKSIVPPAAPVPAFPMAAPAGSAGPFSSQPDEVSMAQAATGSPWLSLERIEQYDQELRNAAGAAAPGDSGSNTESHMTRVRAEMDDEIRRQVAVGGFGVSRGGRR